MVVIEDSIIKIIKRYIEELENNGIKISGAVVFGSYAKGVVHDDSDIDVALISEAFTGNRYDDRRKVVPLRRQIDSRIEPIPFRPEDFNEGSMLVDEIKNTGKKIL
ncbi:MAG: nucleotidyltransferase domain-containing protein [Candidatus Scalindua sp.]|nr:nucleotidyltransferase domain-containing protein [Candidatus Scalindua sp.]